MPQADPICSPTALEIAFRRELEQLWPEGASRRLLLAASGGPDSTALAWLCHNLLGECLEGLVLAHFHHHLRGEEADEDEAFVRALALMLKAPYRRGDWVRHPDERLPREDRNLQAGARHARYAFLVQTALELGIPVVATGHQRDDQIETILLNLARGGGDGAYRGIRERLPRKGVWILRPLLPFARADLRSYLDRAGHGYRIDSSNASAKYTRNRLRLERIPIQAEADPDFPQGLLERHARARHAESLAREALVALRARGLRESGRWVLPRNSFGPEHGETRFLCLRELLRELLPEDTGWYPIRRAPLRRLFALLDSGGQGVVNLPKGIRAEVRERTLVLESGWGGCCPTSAKPDSPERGN